MHVELYLIWCVCVCRYIPCSRFHFQSRCSPLSHCLPHYTLLCCCSMEQRYAGGLYVYLYLATVLAGYIELRRERALYTLPTHIYTLLHTYIALVISYALTCELKSLLALFLFAERSFKRLLLPRGLCMYVSLSAIAKSAQTQNSRRTAVIFRFLLPIR